VENESGTSSVSEPPESPAPASPPSHRLEAVAVALVFAVGLGLTAYAVATEPSDADTSSDSAEAAPHRPGASPTVEPDIVASPPTVGRNAPIVFTNARSDITPMEGCQATIEFHWDVDPTSNPPYGAIATVEVTGPSVANPWPYALTEEGVDLTLFPTLSQGKDKWTAEITEIISEPGRDIVATPLELSYFGGC
jgi:hypothetical protein